jgi:penicillin-binding protein A
MVSYAYDKDDLEENLALKATFPSASVFKVVTAAAAIEKKQFSASTVIPFDGRNHTLYRNNVLKTKYTRWTRYITLREAFARSVNTVFAKIGAFSVGADVLSDYAGRFGFNRKISADVPFDMGSAPITDEPWALAESASGFTRDNTMSPLHGALIAATVVNEGRMMEPYIVESVHTTEGTPIYAADPSLAAVSVDPRTAMEVRSLMRETITHGTSHGSFRGFFKRAGFRDLDVGGKTGSLTGFKPRGKYDWFVGFAESGNQRIAVAALTVHKKLWRVKSSYLARRAFERFFKDHGARTLAQHGGTAKSPRPVR